MLKKLRSYLKPLSTLPQNGEPFRIDAFGSIRKNPYSNSNPLIDIIISPLSDGANLERDIMSPRRVKPELQESYQISAGEFSAFNPGCILRNGLIEFKPIKPTFNQSIDISPDKIKFIPADLKIDRFEKQNYLIPPYVYPLGSALRSTLLAIEQDGDPYAILIPTMEILRNCYCGSSALNKLIFSSDVDDLAQLTTKEFYLDEANQKLELCLRKKFPDADAIVIGNSLTNKRASLEIKKVWSSLVRQMYFEKGFYSSALEIGFPVAGEIHIQALHVELPPSEFGRKRKLLTSLLGCFYPLPFSYIELRRENFGSQGPKNPEEKDDNNAKNVDAEVAKNNKLWLYDAQETEDGVNDPFAPPSGYVDRKFVETPSNRFPNVHIKKVTREKTGTRSKVLLTLLPSLQMKNQSTSDSTFGKSHNTPISIVPKENNDKNFVFRFSDFTNFREICERLKQSPHVKNIRPVVINGPRNNVNRISQFPIYKDHKPLKWPTIHEDGFPIRPRQLLFMKVRTRSKGKFYLMEVERKKSENNNSFAIYLFRNDQRSNIPSDILKEILLKLAANHFKHYRETFISYGLHIQSRKHTGSIDECATSIMDKMFGYF